MNYESCKPKILVFLKVLPVSVNQMLLALRKHPYTLKEATRSSMITAVLNGSF